MRITLLVLLIPCLILGQMLSGSLTLPVYDTRPIGIADGDSITFGYGLLTDQSYPRVGWQILPVLNGQIIDVAIDGSTTDNVIARIPTTVQPLPAMYPHAANLTYWLMIGTNDIRANSRSAAYVYANIQTICSTVKGYGFNNVVVSTILPWEAGTSEAVRLALNTLIRNGGSCTYTVADTGSDPTMGQVASPMNTTYYFDQLHPTAVGDVLIATTYFRSALQGLGF